MFCTNCGKKFLLVLFALIIAQTACFANSSIIIENYNEKDVTNALIKLFIKKGAYIENKTDVSFSALIGYKHFILSFPFLNLQRYAPWMIEYNSPTCRFYFSAIQDNKNTLLSLTMDMKTSSSGYSYFITGRSYPETMYVDPRDEAAVLNEMKNALKGYYSYGFYPQKEKGKLLVKEVNYNLDAYKNGIYANNVITKINDKNVKKLSYLQIRNELIPINDKQEIKITFKENKNKKAAEKEVILKSMFVKPNIDSL